ncbi:MAG: DUF3149 domain-containing protein [Burkholderiaceae bacterium]
MELWSVLFSDWVGIASFLVIVIVILIGGWFLRYFMTNVAQAPSDAPKAGSQGQAGSSRNA